MHMTYLKAQHAPSRFFRGAPQFIDLKQLADLEAHFRGQCRAALRDHRASRQAADGADDLLERHYRTLATALSRRRAEDAVRLYGVMRRDLRRNVKRYIDAAQAAKF